MEQRFRVRLKELLSDAEVPPGLLRGVLPRLEAFLQPLVAAPGLSMCRNMFISIELCGLCEQMRPTDWFDSSGPSCTMAPLA